jgi:hypothetical protein
MLTVALMHPNGGITHQQFTARTEAQAWLNNNRKIGEVFVIISDAEAFRAKPVSSELSAIRTLLIRKHSVTRRCACHDVKRGC